MWTDIEEKLPEDGDHILVSCPYMGVLDIENTVVKLALFMTTYRDDKGRFAKNGWFNEPSASMIEGVKRWTEIPEGAI